MEIPCPNDCAWLASAREHPPAVTVRQQQRDLGVLVQFMRDLSERQSQVFFLVATFLNEYRPSELQSVADEDASEAVDALASTYETAARGVIYEHRPPSLPAERLLAALKPVVAEAGKGGGSAFERDAAIVLRRVGEAARSARSADESNGRAFLDLLRRVMRRTDAAGGRESPERGDTGSRLIVP